MLLSAIDIPGHDVHITMDELGKAYAATGDTTNAILWLQRSIQLHPTASALNNLANLLKVCPSEEYLWLNCDRIRTVYRL